MSGQMNNSISPELSRPSDHRTLLWLAGIAVFTIIWFVAYTNLTIFADFVLSLTPWDRSSHIGEAIHFFFYDTPKVLLLLVGIVFLMGIVQTFFAPEKTRALLAGRRLGVGNTMAALLGIVTPFCSCSAVPLFIGFLSAGVPLGITFSFLIAAPMVNEIALALLLGMFGWKVAGLYLLLGLGIAIFAGLIIGKLNMEKYLQDWVRDIHSGAELPSDTSTMSWDDRFMEGWNHVKEIVGKVWPYILIGISVGALIHGFVPEDFMASFMGKDAWWSVPAAVVMGVPMYTNAAGVIPIVEALIGKGAALGTTLAFMMSVIALSLPEILILRKVLKARLIATFVGVVAGGILLVGFLFNIIL
jgi:uncharacterized membrane protein YraQ (UPF0718 family)